MSNLAKNLKLIRKRYFDTMCSTYNLTNGQKFMILFGRNPLSMDKICMDMYDELYDYLLEINEYELLQVLKNLYFKKISKTILEFEMEIPTNTFYIEIKTRSTKVSFSQ